jgi:hypothetical protein
MGALTIAFDTTIVGALALPWIFLVIQLFLFHGENRFGNLLNWIRSQRLEAFSALLPVAAVVLFAVAYTLGSGVSRVAKDFFDDDDLHVRIAGHLLRNSVSERRILTRLYCDTDSSLLNGQTGNPALAERIKDFQGQTTPCSQALAKWLRHKHDRQDGDVIGIAEDIFGLQENALMVQGGDYTTRLRELHEEVMVLRGAAFNGVIAIFLCVFAWGAALGREKPGSWLRRAIMLVPLFCLAAGLIALINHFDGAFPTDPPLIEFTLLLLAGGGAWLVWRRPLWHPAHQTAGKDAAGGKKEEEATRHCLPEARWGRLVALSFVLTAAVFLGWWSTEVFYAQQVIYSYDTQGAVPK